MNWNKKKKTIKKKRETVIPTIDNIYDFKLFIEELLLRGVEVTEIKVDRRAWLDLKSFDSDMWVKNKFMGIKVRRR